jgi:DNA polymerase (family 10)
MTNAEIARILNEIAAFLEMEGVAFKPRAYEKAAHAVEVLDEPVTEVFKRGGVTAVEKIPGVGKSIAEKIATLIEDGHLPYYEALKKKTPVDVAALISVEGVGPKMIKTLYDELGVRTLDDLEAAARAGRIHELPHFGEKSEQKILKGIGFQRQSKGRFTLGTALPLLSEIEVFLAELKGVRRVAIAGSTRRRKETVGDGDLLVVAKDADAVMDAFVAMDSVVHVHGKGHTKASVKLHTGMDVDLRIVPAESWGAALNYFTGSKDHNVTLRKMALAKKLKLNEYGVFRGDKRIAGETEEEVYAILGLAYVPPELRENTGEIEAAAEDRLPKLIGYDDVRGDLQIQTKWTDGANTIEEIVAEARRLGREYIAITDHTKGLAMMGQDEKGIRKQGAAIDKLNKSLRGFRILKGAEVNINKDGSLDIDDETLATLDLVGVAIHSHFNLARAEMTRRVIRAMENPHVHILFHPTARILQEREACDIDIDAVINAAKRTGTALEIDAYPDRLDLKDEHVRKAVEAGVKLVIDTDAHSLHHLGYMDYGIATARRGWATKADVLNTKPLKSFLGSLKK